MSQDLPKAGEASAKMSPWTPETNALILRRVGKMGEELSELAKVCFRIVIQGAAGIDPSTGRGNLQELQREMADVRAQFACATRDLDLDTALMDSREHMKMGHMADWDSHFKAEPAPVSIDALMGETWKYLDLLRAHDWSYEMSDDQEVWKRGVAERQELRAMQKKLDPTMVVWKQHAK